MSVVHHYATAKSTPFAVSRMGYKGRLCTSKSMKNPLCILWMPKGTSWADETLNSEKYQAHAYP